MIFDSRPKVNVCVAQTGETYPCATTESLLRGMLKLGRKGIPAGCVNGGCGVCKVRVTEGHYAKRKMSRAVVSEEEEAQGRVLACKTYPRSDMTVEVVGKMVRAVVARRCVSFGFEFATTRQVVQPDKER